MWLLKQYDHTVFECHSKYQIYKTISPGAVEWGYIELQNLYFMQVVEQEIKCEFYFCRGLGFLPWKFLIF